MAPLQCNFRTISRVYDEILIVLGVPGWLPEGGFGAAGGLPGGSRQAPVGRHERPETAGRR